MIKAIIFDLDNTLYDENVYFLKVFKNFLLVAKKTKKFPELDLITILDIIIKLIIYIINHFI